MPEQKVTEVSLEIDPGRIVFGLSRIGYIPATAICDILDNSVRAKAQNIYIQILKEREDLNDNKKNNIKEYLVIDDGKGMNETEMIEALKLGSSDQAYEANSLSKFGLGLKSAVFSQGEELHLISSPGDTHPFKKYIVSLPEIQQEGRYFAKSLELTEDDQCLIDQYLPSGKGTIVRIGKVRMVNHPSVKKTTEELTTKVGVIYYYFMREDDIKISINDKSIEPFDVLFIDEADSNGNLDENSWDGKTVKWIEKPKEITLDLREAVKAKIEVTQLPYPPIFDLEERGKRSQVASKYKIGAGNYGYYVYRNKRLISWAESFDGIIPQDQDFYAFRGRILIDESADDSFNIDVKKSTLTLSDEAYREISDRSDEYKRKSKRAWLRGNFLKKEFEGQDPNLTANEIAAEFEPLDSLPGEPIATPAIEREKAKRGKEVEEEMQTKLRQTAVQLKSDTEGREVDDSELDEDDLAKALREDTNPAGNKIYKVSNVEDNALWEPYYDTDHGGCVRINKFHRFARLVFEENSENKDLQVMIQLLLLQMSDAEVYAQKTITSLDRKDVQQIISEYRRIISEYLAAMCRQLDGKLPPLGQS
ncbi:ATP-binding protein [Tumidithrix helvetica PCC 7403]|uniref:ATP-binding protein n=1 Tax=Tumidithrix helvetica TaxID=3457545 RepID=UPI003CA63990